jgi:hypothetical protein
MLRQDVVFSKLTPTVSCDMLHSRSQCTETVAEQLVELESKLSCFPYILAFLPRHNNMRVRTSILSALSQATNNRVVVTQYDTPLTHIRTKPHHIAACSLALMHGFRHATPTTVADTVLE